MSCTVDLDRTDEVTNEEALLSLQAKSVDVRFDSSSKLLSSTVNLWAVMLDTTLPVTVQCWDATGACPNWEAWDAPDHVGQFLWLSTKLISFFPFLLNVI